MPRSSTSAAIRPARRLRGTLRPPADKSIAHRALIANALAAGGADVTVRRPGADLRSTAAALRRLAAAVEAVPDGERVTYRVTGGGEPGTIATLRGPPVEIDCGNSGTTMRLLAGVAATLEREVTLVGDPSLTRRPMGRVAEPLRAMGARLETDDGRPPLRVRGRRPLRAVEHRLPVPSAQVLGAILLAGLAADGTTRVTLPAPCRDHTERMLAWMGAPVERRAATSRIDGPAGLVARSVVVPGDPSAAAAWLVAAALHPDAELRLIDVGLNPTRLAAVGALREMGAAIEVTPSPAAGPEPVGEIRVRSAGALEAIAIGPEPVGEIHVRSAGALEAIAIGPERAAELIDELPLLAVAMAGARGTSELRGAAELRVKESDRIAAVVGGLAALGARVEELPDGWRIAAGSPRGAAIRTGGDHRIAIAFAVAAAAGVAPWVEVDDPACASVSYPGFWEDLATVAADAQPTRGRCGADAQ